MKAVKLYMNYIELYEYERVLGGAPSLKAGVRTQLVVDIKKMRTMTMIISDGKWCFTHDCVGILCSFNSVQPYIYCDVSST